jgi:hypothetical protein
MTQIWMCYEWAYGYVWGDWAALGGVLLREGHHPWPWHAQAPGARAGQRQPRGTRSSHAARAASTRRAARGSRPPTAHSTIETYLSVILMEREREPSSDVRKKISPGPGARDVGAGPAHRAWRSWSMGMHGALPRPRSLLLVHAPLRLPAFVRCVVTCSALLKHKQGARPHASHATDAQCSPMRPHFW